MNDCRVGIHVGQQHSDYESYKSIWLEAEKLGLDWASVFDHFLPIQSDPTGSCFEGFTLASAMAASTSRLAVGIIVTGVTYRHPAVVANMAATIDHVSGHRMELGMGAAWYELEHQQYGIPFLPFKDRAQMLDEALSVIKGLFLNEKFSFNGRFFHLNNALMQPKPIGKLPIWIGGLGERYILRLVAKHADGWNALMVDPETYERKCEVLKKHLKEFSREYEEIRKALILQAIIGETHQEAQELVKQRASELKVDPELLMMGSTVGTVEEVAEKVQKYYQLGVRDFLMLMRPPKNDRLLELLALNLAPIIKSF